MKITYGDPLINRLVKNAAKGDERSASKIYQQYAKAMYNTLVRMTNNEEEAQDLLQDAFVKAFAHLGHFKAESTFGAWLKRIVINTGLEQLRKRKLEYVKLDDPIQEPEHVEGEAINWEDILSDVALVRKAIGDLPTGTRSIVTCYLLEGYTHDEISEMMGISSSTSKTQYMRGKKMVKQAILTHYGKRSF